jgi:site-specific DNA recombinase
MARKINKGKDTAKQAELGLAHTCTALYIRVSTQLQADEGFSLDDQRERLQAYCTSQGWHVCPDHIYVDAGVSGKSTDRPAFQAMLRAAQAGQVQRIVAMKLDRIARNTQDFLATVDQLKAYGCALALVKENFETSTPQGKFAITLFAAIAEMEASMITERVMSGKAKKAKDGDKNEIKSYYNGSRCPFGYTYVGNGQFAKHEAEAATVREIFNLFLAGQSLNSIAKALNAAGAPTKTGGTWYAMTVRQTITNGIYAGIAQWNGVEVPDAYPAIITNDVYEAAHKRLQALRPGKQLESEIERRLAHPELHL